jgi:hypothetical protein
MAKASMKKFRCTHTETVTTVVEIEITAKNREEAECINDDWQIEQGKTRKVRIIGDPEINHGDYDVSPLKEVRE